MRRTTTIFVLLALVLLGGLPSARGATASAPAAGWPELGHDRSRSYHYPYPSAHDLTPLAFTTAWSAPVPNGGVLAADVHASPGLEAVMTVQDDLRVLSASGALLSSTSIPGVASAFGTGVLHVELLADFDGDGYEDIVVRRKTADALAIWRVYRGDGALLATGSRAVAPDGHLMGPAARFVQGGRQKLAFFVAANFYGAPRGVALFDYATGAEDFIYTVGGWGGLGGIGDLGGDGLADLVVGSVTTHNGGRGSGVAGGATPTDDSRLHLVALDELGRETFTNIPVAPGHPAHEHGGVQGTIADLDGDGRDEVIAWTDHNYVYPGQDMVYVLNASGTPRHSFAGPTNVVMRGVAVADLDGDGSRELVVGYDDGLVRVLAADLRLLTTLPAKAVRAVADFDGRAGPDLLLQTATGLAIVDYPSGATLWQRDMPVTLQSPVVPTDLDQDGLIDLLAVAGQLQLFEPVFHDADGDGLTDAEDACPNDNPGGRDADADGCTDTAAALPSVIEAQDLPDAVEQSLLDSANAAAASLERGSVRSARGQLGAFINKVNAQAKTGKIAPEVAAMLVAFAHNILDQLPPR